MYNPIMESGDLPPKIPGGMLIGAKERKSPSAMRLIDELIQEGVDLDPRVAMYFEDAKLFEALVSAGMNETNLKEIIKNSSAFNDLKRNAGFFSGEATIDDPASLHQNGVRRRSETGAIINLDYIREKGIDPSKVLFFRRTQPSDSPKPEYFWTTDFFETVSGLQVEIPEPQRQTSVILISDMLTISGSKGLMTDINDDQGLAVRQIGLEPFDQTKAIARIPSSSI